MKQNLQVFCEYKAKDLNSPTDFAMEAFEIIERQRGIWNKNVLKWWLASYTNDIPKVRDLKYAFNIAFTELDIEIPIVFVQADSEDDADIIIEIGMRKDDRYFSNNPNVLAYAGFPDGPLKGYMKILDDWLWNLHGKTGYNIIVMLIHELLHIMGLSHATVQHGEPNSLDPMYNPKMIDMSPYDIERLVAPYGARVYANPEQHDRLEKANSRQKQRLIEEAV